LKNITSNFNRSIKPDRPKCDINIELKSYETAYKVVDLIEKYVSEKKWNYNQFVVSSFDWNALAGLSLNSK
jgi:glycerophosphoryl diester phosphodiesterase